VKGLTLLILGTDHIMGEDPIMAEGPIMEEDRITAGRTLAAIRDL